MPRLAYGRDHSRPQQRLLGRDHNRPTEVGPPRIRIPPKPLTCSCGVFLRRRRVRDASRSIRLLSRGASAAYGRVGFGEFKVEQAAAGDAEASRHRQANATPAPEPNGTAPVPETLTPTAPRGTNHSAGKCLHETNTACAPVTPDAEAAANTTDSAAIQAQSQTITHTKEPNSSTCDSTPTTRSSDEAYANNATMQKPAKQDQQASTPDNKQEHCASPDKKQAPTTVVRAAGSGHTIRASRKAVGIRRRSSS